MWTETSVFREDMEQLTACSYIPWDKLEGKTIFITGATGLIGHALTSTLLYHEQQQPTGMKVAIFVRNIEQAKKKFRKQLDENCSLILVEGTVENEIHFNGPIDYIIHGASPTASSFFVQHPVETINAIVTGTGNILELAKRKQVSGLVYLSSMEVYGKILSHNVLSEDEIGYIDLHSPRSSYPESKRLAETMCCAYASQHQIPVSIARLVQTFGPGVKKDDQRVFAYMARCALDKTDIQLATNGTKRNMYLYTADAVGAILLLLLRGKRGTAYNVGNPETYCSIKEMGEMVAWELGGGSISVNTNVGEPSDLYPPEGFLNLDMERLQSLGWSPSRDLREMFLRMVGCF